MKTLEVLTMENSKTSDKLSAFLESGIYRFENSNVVFIDPVRMLNRSYTRFRSSPSAYYSRFFDSKETIVTSDSKKRKRKEKKTPHDLNEREQAATLRHQVTINSLPIYYYLVFMIVCAFIFYSDPVAASEAYVVEGPWIFDGSY